MMRNGFNKESLVKTVDNPKQRYVFHNGEGFKYETLPLGTRVLYPPPPLPGIQDVDAAIEDALDHPMDSAPLSAMLKRGGKVTIAFDDVSLPLPPMVAPDLRGRIIEHVLHKLATAGITDVHIVAALGLHRRMTPGELRHAMGPRVFSQYFKSGQLYNHDAEDRENIVSIGNTSRGEVVELPKRVMDSDLLVYVNINLSAMDGGHKSISTGLVTYKSLSHHHNVNTLRHSSLMDPTQSAIHDSTSRMGELIEKQVKVFKIETTVNTNTFPGWLRHLQKPEWEWAGWERAIFRGNLMSLPMTPFPIKHAIFHSIRAPYGLTGIAAGATGPVHEYTMKNLYEQQAVPVKGQADIVIAGLTYLMPYNPFGVLNPVLVHCLGLGYLFNLYKGKPLVRKGGVMILVHPMYERFNKQHHPSYVEFYERVLAETNDQMKIEHKFEREFAENPKYIEQYRHGYAYHGVHPFYAWYWGAAGQYHVGRTIAVGADKTVAKRLGYDWAPDVHQAIEMAKDIVGPSPQITHFHYPPIFLADVT